ncbi:MAG: FAD-dependent oxidoreductase [Thermodesulfobacteriota bacterium]
MARKPHIIILGAGPAGVGAAFELTRKGLAAATVVDMCETVGGYASSFTLSGVRVDYGSHRLHPACDAEILEDIRSLLGGDLLERPRHGRIRLQGRWIHFPLRPLDLALRLPPSFAIGTTGDLVGKVLGRRKSGGGGRGGGGSESFASVLEAGLGSTICRDFYFPYVEKIWGLRPEEVSPVQAHRRVSAGSMGKMIRKVLGAVPGLKPEGAGVFYYPKSGFGEITEAMATAAEEAGAEFVLGSEVTRVALDGGDGCSVTVTGAGKERVLDADMVWSTIPVTTLAGIITPAAPPEVTAAAGEIGYRAMVLVYLVLDTGRFTEFDAHYFPEREIPITRLSEPKNYSAANEPEGRTVLCAELPCATTDPEWWMTDGELADIVKKSIERAGLPLEARVVEATTRRLPHAYPLYRRGYEESIERIDDWLGSLENLLVFGRQGLFVHDNTHHALFMAYSAARCLGPAGRFDRARWEEMRKVFETHVVED